MTNYRIVCTNQEPVHLPPTHAHIVAVGTGTDPNRATQKWSLDQVLTAMDRGENFYTKGTRSGKIARVEKYNCSRCHKSHIRSAADSVADNNLDSLRQCNWNN